MSRGDGRIQPVVARRITEDERPENGRVDKVRWNFIYEGDRGLAQRLQQEEFSNHFNKNREERWVMRENLKEAKVVQTEEEELLQIARMQEIERMQELAKRDEELARKLQEEEKVRSPGHNFDEERQLRADEMLALRLEEYEKGRMKRYREFRRKQLEQEDIQRAMSTVSLNGTASGLPIESTPEPITEEEHFDSDFTDFLSQLPEGLTPNELKVIQELEDNALAKLLQEAESKRSGARTAAERMNFIRRRAVELRDEQLARLVQQREINRFNERRQKAMSGGRNTSDGSSAPNIGHVPPTSVTARPHSNQVTTYSAVVPRTVSSAPSQSLPTTQVYVNTNDVNGTRAQMNPPQTRPRPMSGAFVEASQPPLIPSSSHQRTDSFMGAVSKGLNPVYSPTPVKPPDRPPNLPMFRQQSSVIPEVTELGQHQSQDDYMTPSSLLDASSAYPSTPVVGEGTDYELPPETPAPSFEMDQPAASRSHRHRHSQITTTPPFVVYPPASDRRASGGVLPPLPTVSPGALPTVGPPAHLPSRQSSSGGGGGSHYNNRQHTSSHFHSPVRNNSDASVPVVTNPMYIVERPTRQKSKGSSDCKQQ